MEPQACDKGELEGIVNQLLIDGLVNGIQNINPNETRVLASFAKDDFITYVKTLHGSRSLNYLCRLYRNGELKGFVNEWIELWVVKWRQRVKLMFRESQEDQGMEFTDDLKLVGKREVGKMGRLIRRALIENNEICGIDAVSNYLTMQFLRELIDLYGASRVNQMIKDNDPTVLSYVVSRVNDIAKTQQPLVVLFLKIDERRQLFMY
ncbi:hypothetical protein [Caldivirga maquilingensis]|uniref:Uncharacterized protein n=1 Tax=Caldivirga maquilingensis (strain ATCC 700844 / DSM 13496 / JCM 10307 / IC-167) TaxID=397948 RepID=A8MDI7_CALMQ|nr:hypothetical protein [Caldivirga maquilingensis]ABW01843.1 hypothetical protein Cmaq_1012 [Caldivirga maquilingensis IC-167]